MEISTAGSPSGREGGGSTTSPTQGGGMVPAPAGGREELILNRVKDDESPPIQQETKDHPLTHDGGNEPPPTRIDRGQNEGRKRDSHKNRPEKSARQTHTSRELRMLDHSDEPLPKRVRRPTRGMDQDNSCEVTRESNMICPITCGCHNSLLDISKKTRVVSQILRSTRKIWNHELIAIFGLTSAITKTDEISELKQAQEKRNSDLYSTSMQYTVLGKIHGKEVYLVPPQDAALLLEDRISLKLLKV